MSGKKIGCLWKCTVSFDVVVELFVNEIFINGMGGLC